MGYRKKPFFFLGFLFFLSGFSGLVLQVIWTRKIALVFGSTIISASITIAAFMFGLGLGAYIAGRSLSGWKNLIFLYACLELSIGISAFIVTLLIPSFTPFSVFISNSLSDIKALQLIVKFLVVFITLLIPCTAMGATLPVLTQAFTGKDENFGRVLGILYAINTSGAALGAFLSDFTLVELAGVIETAFFAGTINILVSLGAFVYSKNLEIEVNEDLFPREKVKADRSAYFIFAFTGFCSIACEIVWVRVLVFFNGCDVFAFSSMLTTFLLGIVLGSIFISICINKIKDKKLTLGIMLLITGFFSFTINILAIEWIVPVRNCIIDFFSLSFPLDRFLADAMLMLPCTILFGAIFPLNSKILQEKIKHPGQTVGEAYLLNTFGSIAGSLFAGFLIIPLLGLQGSIALLSSLLVLSGTLYILFTVEKNMKIKVIISILSLCLVTGIFVIPRNMVIKGVYYLYIKDEKNIIYQTEDIYSSIALIREWDNFEHDYTINLITDGYNMASNNFISRRYAMSLSLVPALIHDKPDDILVIAMGLTNTLYGAQAFNITKQVDCVELSGAVAGAVKKLEHAKKALTSPKVKVIINDGRNYLLTTEKKYDIITAEPPPPINAGIVNLYSKEYYELCKKSLKPGGIVTQWLPVAQMSDFEARTIIRAFQDVFPFTYLWGWDDLNFCLMGSMEELSVDYPRLKQRISDNEELMESIGIKEPEIFMAGFLKGPDSLREYCQGTPPLTDNRPYIQYSRGDWIPDRGYYLYEEDRNKISINEGYNEKDRKENKREIEKGLLAVKLLRQYKKTNSGSLYLDVFARTLLAKEILNLYGENRYFLFVTEANEKVREFYIKNIEKDPSNPAYFFQLARIDYLRGKLDKSIENIDLAVTKAHISNKPFYKIYKALILETSGKKDEAIEIYKNSLKETEIPDLLNFVNFRLESPE